jgi:hypothetical protein
MQGRYPLDNQSRGSFRAAKATRVLLGSNRLHYRLTPTVVAAGAALCSSPDVVAVTGAAAIVGAPLPPSAPTRRILTDTMTVANGLPVSRAISTGRSCLVQKMPSHH